MVSQILLGERRVDLSERMVYRSDGSAERLTGTEVALLAYLARHADRGVDRDELLVEVWGWSPGVVTRTVDNAIRRLRLKLEDDPGRPRTLITVFGQGYRLVLPETDGAPVAEATVVLAWRVSGFSGLVFRAPDLAEEVLRTLGRLVPLDALARREGRGEARYPDVRAAAIAGVEALRAVHTAPWSASLLQDPVCHSPPAEGPWRGPRVAWGVGRASGELTASDRATALVDATHGGSLLMDASDLSIPGAVVVPVGGHDLGGGRREPLVRVLPVELASRTFPAPRTRATWRTNLSVEWASFYGRRREISVLRRVMETPGVWTLHGPAGAGKTRLALRLAWDRVPPFSLHGGVWFVDASACFDEGDLLAAVGGALGVPLDPAGDVDQDREQIGRALRELGQVLLVLDNLEQVEEPARTILMSWREAAPMARFLLTSRLPLRVPGEVVLPVPALDPTEGAALFLDRALAAWPDRLDPLDDRAFVDEVVRRLEGNALAIELAAARVGVLSPPELLRRLDDQLLRIGRLSSAGVPERQSCLQAAIAWSWDLLDAAERDLLQVLALFPSGAVPAAIDDIRPGDTDTLRRLIDHALARVEEPSSTPGKTRARLPLSVQVFALEQLALTPDRLRDWRSAQVSWLLRYTSDLLPRIEAQERAAAHLLEQEVENLRVAFRWSIAQRPELAPPLATVLVPALVPRGPHAGLLEILDVALAVPSRERSALARARAEVRALRWDGEGADSDLKNATLFAHVRRDQPDLVQALLARARLASRRGQVDLANALAAAANAHCEVDDAPGQADILVFRARAAANEGDLAEAARSAMRARAELDVLSRHRSRADLDVDLAAWSAMTNDPATAVSLLTESLRGARASGDIRLEARALGWLGQVRHEQGRLEEADRLLDEAIRLSVRLGDRRRAGAARGHRAAVALEAGDPSALAILDAALADLAGGSDARLEGWFLAWRASSSLAVGDGPGALAGFRRALSLVAGEKRLENRVMIRAAWAVLVCGAVDEAHRAWRASIPRAEALLDRDAAQAALVGLSGSTVGVGIESRWGLTMARRVPSTPGTRRT